MSRAMRAAFWAACAASGVAAAMVFAASRDLPPAVQALSAGLWLVAVGCAAVAARLALWRGM